MNAAALNPVAACTEEAAIDLSPGGVDATLGQGVAQACGMRSCLGRWWRYGALILLVLSAAAPAFADQEHDRSALLKLVEGACARDSDRAIVPPCVRRDKRPGFRSAVLKDMRGQYQYLLVPLDVVRGMDDPQLLSAQLPNYFAQAWQARSFVEAAAGRRIPRAFMSLAINSAHGRSQDQLHIHIDCVSPDADRVLERLRPWRYAHGWRDLRPTLAGHHYRVRHLAGAALPDLFALLALDVKPDRTMGDRSLVVVGDVDRKGAPGFWLLSGQVDAATQDRASGEELQDHQCSILEQ